MGKMPAVVFADVEVASFFLGDSDDEFLGCEDELESVALQLSVLLLPDHRFLLL